MIQQSPGMPVSKALQGTCDSGSGFRSPQRHHFSEALIPVNVQWRLTAASLATQAPGGKIVAARVIRLIPSACRVGAEPASMQAVPSARIPAGSPGQPSTPHRFSAGPGCRFSDLAFSYIRFAVQRYSSKSSGGQVWAGPAENCRRVSVRPGEPAGMRVQGAFCMDAASRPAR